MNSETVPEHGSGFLTFLIVPALALAAFALCYIFYPAFEASLRPSGVDAQCRTFQSPSAARTSDSSEYSEEGDILLSLIIPAYNEEERLVSMLDATESYLSAESCPGLEMLRKAVRSTSNTGKKTASKSIGTTVEWILVNDGSKDQTSQVYESYAMDQLKTKKSKNTQMIWRLCSLSQNSGKGAAVQAGMLLAKGRYRLMVDADGATEFGPGLEAVSKFASSHEFVFGSRAVAREESESENHDDDTSTGTSVQRSWIRRLLQAGFHAFVVLIVGNSQVQDTQCGFKLFLGSSAQTLFRDLHLHRWAFDTELFVRAGRLRLNLKEVRVPWQEIDGSKLNTGTMSLIRVAIGMLRDMICVRLCYTMGIWVTEQPEKFDGKQADPSTSSKKDR